MTSSRPRLWFTALEEGDLVGVHRVLRGAVDVDEACPKSGRTPLQIAASLGHRGVVEVLLKVGADDRLTTPMEPRSPLWLAQFHGYMMCAWLLFKHASQRAIAGGCGCDTRDPRINPVVKSSDMIDAARSGDYKRVQCLLEEASVYAHALNERSGETAFTAALVNGRWRVCELLLEHGAGPFGVCLPPLRPQPSPTRRAKTEGDSPVRYAVKERDLRLVQWLIKHGANLYTPSIDGLCSPLSLAAYDGAMEIADELIKHGARLDGKQSIWVPMPRCGDLDIWRLHSLQPGDTTSWLMLAHACWNPCLPSLKYLFQTRPDLHDPKMMEMHGPMMLFLAAYRDDKEIVLELLRRGAPINGRAYDSCTALYGAAQTDSVEMLQLLIDNGADTKLTRTKNFGVSLLTSAAEYGAFRCVKRLLDVDPASLQWHGYQALDAAVKNEYTEITALLMDRLPKPIDYVARDSLVSCAIDCGSTEMLELLLSHGIDPPLPILQNGFVSACMRGHVEVVKVLLSYGADANASYMGGVSLLLHQVLCQVEQGETYLQIARLLMQHGADVHSIDALGETPLGVVRRRLTPEKPLRVRRLLEAVVMELGLHGAVM